MQLFSYFVGKVDGGWGVKGEWENRSGLDIDFWMQISRSRGSSNSEEGAWLRYLRFISICTLTWWPMSYTCWTIAYIHIVKNFLGKTIFYGYVHAYCVGVHCYVHCVGGYGYPQIGNVMCNDNDTTIQSVVTLWTSQVHISCYHHNTPQW